MEYQSIDKEELNKIALEARYVRALDPTTQEWSNFVEDAYENVLKQCLSNAKEGRMNVYFDMSSEIRKITASKSILESVRLAALSRLRKELCYKMQLKGFDCIDFGDGSEYLRASWE
jgi:hypothetical protein